MCSTDASVNPNAVAVAGRCGVDMSGAGVVTGRAADWVESCWLVWKISLGIYIPSRK